MVGGLLVKMLLEAMEQYDIEIVRRIIRPILNCCCSENHVLESAMLRFEFSGNSLCFVYCLIVV